MNKGKYNFEIIVKDIDKEKIVKHEIHENVSEINIDYDTEIENDEAIVKQLRIFVRR